MKKLICIYLGLCFFLNLIQAQDMSLQDQIHALLGAEEKAGFSGAVLVWQNDRLLVDQGYGFTDQHRKYRITPNTIFNVASITKSFTAIAILQLIEQGKLHPQDRLSNFFENLPEDKKDISIHQLLTHRSGFPQSYVCMKKRERTACMQAIFAEQLVGTPGRTFHYSNHNYAILAAIIEVSCKRSWEEYLTKRILSPAQLSNTYFWGAIDDRNPAQVAQKIDQLDKKTRQRNWDYLGSGGLYTTTRDLYTFFQALQAGKLLSEAYQKLLFTPACFTKSGLGIGYGWFISSTPKDTLEYWTRGSESFGHNAVLRWFPKKNTLLIVCTNTGEQGGKSQTDNQRISNLIVDIMKLF